MALFLPDANVLIHALRKASDQHSACRKWLLNTAHKGHEIGLTELTEVALLRIPTLPRLNLIPIDEVIPFWDEDLWGYPHTRRLSAGTKHRSIFIDIVKKLALAGNDLNDAWLAALAIEHHATLVTTDDGFSRFPNLDWIKPA